MAKKSEVTLIREHLKERHRELFGIDYVTNNFAMEGRMIKNCVKEYGYDVTRRFIDVCMDEYKPTRQFPGINFVFMYSYRRAQVIPRIQAEIKREQEQAERLSREPEQSLSDDEFSEFI